jgi:hypothetical protein
MPDEMKSPRQPVGAGPGAVLEERKKRISREIPGQVVLRRGSAIAYVNASRTLVDLTIPQHGTLVLNSRRDLEDLAALVDVLLNPGA